METRVQGLVLKSFPYSESSHIFKIYTRELGLIAVLGRGTKKAKSRIQRLEICQPYKLELTKGKSDLYLLKESNRIGNYESCLTNPVKISVLFYVAEVTHNCLQSEMVVPELFELMTLTLDVLESTSKIGTVHLAYLNHLATLLGIFPENNYSQINCTFNVAGSSFEKGVKHNYPFSESLKLQLNKLQSELKSDQKIEIIQLWEQYFKHHLGYFRPTTSSEILHQLFR